MKKDYTSKEKFGFFIVDTNGHYNGSITLSRKSLENANEMEWTYACNVVPNSWHGNEKLAEIIVKKLRDLRDLCGLKDIDWEVKYLNCDRVIGWGLDKLDRQKTVFTNIDIPKGMKTKHKKALNVIVNHYKPIIKEIEHEWIKECDEVC
ncbi:MAG: hypothetical protein APF84_12580 [Gracilibacter sp. BRH_c7a]|nr:MAG: hypothetical protein APF84_12580 [Gracilibacter sp. BRH_c7a]